MWKKIILFLFFIFSFFYTSYATGDCDQFHNKFTIKGDDFTKVGVLSRYYIEGVSNAINWNIIKNNYIVYTGKNAEFIYSFKTSGPIVLKANFNYNGCDIQTFKNIYVYDKIILFIGENKNGLIPYEQLKKKNILFLPKSLDEVKKNLKLIKLADFILLGKNDAIPFLKLIRENNILIDNKKIIFFIDSYQGFYSKFIIPYLINLDKRNIYIYKTSSLANILENIYENKDFDSKNSLSNFNSSNKIYFPLSYFTNKLIENGVSIDILSLVFLLLLAGIVVAIFRQIIGFSVFGVYTPLIFSIFILFLGFKVVLFTFILSILANIITHFVTKKVYVLISSKIALNYIIYVILSIIVIGILLNLNLIDLGYIGPMEVVLFFTMPLLSKNLAKEDTNIFSKSFWIFLLEFSFITFVLLIIFKINTLKYILVAYPDLIWILMIITILIGRFTGLQLLEYIRFYPLIKNNIYEEEE